jgi:cell wall-associated NlpC family hydrolase
MRLAKRFTPRPLVAATFVVALLGLSVSGSSAQPNPSDLSAARSRLSALNDRLSLLDEQYNAAGLRVSRLRSRLGGLQATADRARNAWRRARAELSERAAAAYMQGANRFELLLGSTSFSEFADRLEYLDRMSQLDSDVAVRTTVLGKRARWTASRVAETLGEAEAVADSLAATRADIEQGVAEQRALIDRLEQALNRPVVISPPVASPGTVPLADLPPASASAQEAVRAAYSVIGTPYRYGGASPEGGFDCSGLTMWSWAHAGVSLPHSSGAQYGALPHVPRERLQPGDLVFFYSPIHHVGMYIGGGRMIDAPHTGSFVGIRDVMWDVYVGAGRPGV